MLIIFINNHNFVQIVQPYKQAQQNCNVFFDIKNYKCNILYY